MNDTNAVGRLAVRYADSPVLQALLALVPGGGALDPLLAKRAAEIQAARLRALYDELGVGGIGLDSELLESEDFLHCHQAVVAATVRTRREEKIRLFARLLKAAVTTEDLRDVDEVEEMLQILDDMSLRELLILSVLRRYEETWPEKSGLTQLQIAVKFWPTFADEMCHRLQVEREEFNAMLTRLNRTGCFADFTAGTWGD